QAVPFLRRQARHKRVRIERRRGCKREKVAAIDVHHDDGPARVGSLRSSGQGTLSGLLNRQRQREHYVLARFGRRRFAFRLAIAAAVDQDRFDACLARQLRIEQLFYADRALVVRQSKIEEALLIRKRAVIATKVAQGLSSKRTVRINTN